MYSKFKKINLVAANYRTFFKVIKTSETGVLQNFGKFHKLVRPGLSFYIPGIQKISKVSNRVGQDNFTFEVRTSDNVFSNIGISIQYRIEPDNTQKAFFSLEQPKEQIKSYIENMIRSATSKMSLEELFNSQDHLSEVVKTNLSTVMGDFGFTIENTLINGINPSQDVKDSMNKIQEEKNFKQAAVQQSEAEYILAVKKAESDYVLSLKQAEADKLRKKLQGEGIRDMRIAILDGFQDKIFEMSNKFNLSPSQIIGFVQTIQKLDTLESIGTSQNSKVLFMDTNTRCNDSMISAIESTNHNITKE